MSDNRPASRQTPKTLADYYNDFFSFVIDTFLPIIPQYIKDKPEFGPCINTIKNYCTQNKNFVLVHYGASKKICDDQNTKKSIKNILSVVDGTEEGNKKLNDSVKELKDLAGCISAACQTLIETPDDVIKENIEKFALYIEIITQQFV
jgi:hypothetical protein